MTKKELEIIQLVHWLSNPWVALLVAVLVVWTIIWKATALWKAARNGSIVWFIVLLFVNTIGILEMIYIFFFSNKKKNPSISSGQ